VKIHTEIVYATEQRQELLSLEIEAGTTLAAAVELSKLGALFPDEDFDVCAVGIWGRPVERSQVVRDGDRIELYRPLQKDPREARRERALASRA